MSDKGFLQVFVEDVICLVKMKETLEAQAVFSEYHGIDGYILLQGTGSANPNQVQTRMLLFFDPFFQVDVHQGIQLVDDNVDVVGPDTCGDYREALAFQLSDHRSELSLLG
jgi:predicted RNA-binding protein